jgi:hypothetical protein
MYEPISLKEQSIKERLIQNGATDADIQFRDTGKYRYVRYGYWKRLTDKQLEGLDLEEDLYEDMDGDDYRGRPIYIKQYSYRIK